MAMTSQSAFSQEKCAVVAYQKLMQRKYPSLESNDKFEKWMQEKITFRKTHPTPQARQSAVTIPVVVHIVHFGEPIGTGRNISDAQVNSQMSVLNEDFRRMNADASNTPADFLPVAADVGVEFELAKRDPEGLPTNGIVRVQGDKAVYKLEDQYEMKSLSYWPAEDYLNIWVADIDGAYLGYAQFPVSSLQGLEDASAYDLTDGVAIDYQAFGSVDYGPFNLITEYNLGRTTTHEVGHFLGLRHIWGDGDCTMDDFCADTPSTDTDHAGLGDCIYPTDINGCGTNDMFQNYMDYTDDGCMNLFTEDQKARIETVLNSSPRRASLLTSKGNEAPVVAANDLGIRSIISPQNSSCETLLLPEIVVRNYGSNAISSAQITVSVDGMIQETLNVALNLANLEMDTVSFSSIDVLNYGTYSLEFEVISTNNTTDGNADNNIKSISTTVPVKLNAPQLIDFETTPIEWTIDNLDGLRTWEVVTAPNEDPNNQALRIDFFDYEQQGELDLLLSPVIDLSNTLTAVLSFDVAYAQFPSTSDEGLIVTISPSCADPLYDADTIFNKFDKDLSTQSTASYYTPINANDWRTELIDISEYAGNSSVRIAFIARNNYGNNLYIDNLAVVGQDKPDITIKNITSPSRVSCATDQALSLEVKNVGAKPIGSFDLEYSLDGGEFETFHWEAATSADSLLLNTSAEINIDLPTTTLGEHELSVFVLNPNNADEFNTDDNYELYRFTVNQNEELPPIKEAFESFGNTLWVINNPDGQTTWEIASTNKGNSIALKGNTYTSIGEEDWLVSPIIDFSNLEAAFLNYNVGYANSIKGKEVLSVKISTDCGVTYENLRTRGGEELATTNTLVENFVPSTKDDWQNVDIDLNQYLGESAVRFAFVSTNDNGNNIFLDDIQLYVTGHDDIVANTMYPNPSIGKPVNLTFDLDRKETITVLVYDRAGNLVLEDQKPNTLNQTYTLDLRDKAEGFFIVKVIGESFSFTKRLIQTRGK